MHCFSKRKTPACHNTFLKIPPCHQIQYVLNVSFDASLVDLDTVEDSACANVEITKNKTLKGGTRAGKFHSMGKKNMKKCINECCGRPNCDIAYQLNGHCYSVECSDGKLCAATNEPAREGDDIQLAYMNKNGLNEKQRGKAPTYYFIGQNFSGKSAENLVQCRKFCPPKILVCRNILSAENFVR